MPYNQFEWNKHYFHDAPYWVKNFKTSSGAGQGRIYRSGKEFRTETFVYPPDKPVIRGPGHLVNTLKDAKDTIDDYFKTIG